MLWRTTGAWGSGLGRDLNADEIDGNFFELAQAVDAMTAIGGVNSIDDFTVVGDQMTVLMTDHTTRGPFTIPGAAWNATGEWQPLFVYSLRDTFSINGSVYEVIFPHTSAATFDAGANSGGGDPQDYYHLMLSSPANTLPTGGTVGMVLRKFTTTDFETIWGFVGLEELSDVALSSPMEDGQALQWDDGIQKWTNVSQTLGLDTISGVLGYNKTLEGKVTDVTSTSGTLLLDRNDGAIFTVTLTENVTSIVIDNADGGSLGFKNTVELFISNPDGFEISSLDFWINALWTAGTPPPVLGTHFLWVEIVCGGFPVPVGRILLTA